MVLAPACSIGIAKTLNKGTEIGIQITGDMLIMIANIINNSVVAGGSREVVKPRRTWGTEL